MGNGMISYQIPIQRYPGTCRGQPLTAAALAAQKHYFSLHLTAEYSDRKQEAKLRHGFKRAGNKLDMGKSFVRFSTLDNLPMEALGRAVAAVPPGWLIEHHGRAIRRR
jgi:hypothetical protein